MKSAVALLALFALGMLNVKAGDIRRISLDGKDGVAAPAEEPGKDKINRIHKVETPQMLLYPTAKKPSRGTVIVCPGGGYAILAINHEGTEIATMINETGWDVAVLEYRVSEGPKTRDMAIEDARKALDLIQKRGGEFGLETKKIGAMGFSAGGHLTARLAHESATTKPLDFMVLMYPAYLEKEGKLLDEVIPPAIPSFVYVAANDGYKTSSIAFDAYAREHKLKCDYTLATGGGHGFGLKKPLPDAVKDWPEKLAAFLDAQK